MLIDNNGIEILNQIDSVSPTPGGGSVSALVGALGVCLVRMYGHLTVNKKKFLALEENLQTQFKNNFEQIINQKEELVKAIDKDCDAYDAVMNAYRLPKGTDEEIKKRNKAIKQATYIAIESPYNIMSLSLDAIRLCVDLVDHGNINAISDLACGVIFLEAAIQSAALNVQINLSMLEEAEKNEWSSKMNSILDESHELKESIVNQVKNIL